MNKWLKIGMLAAVLAVVGALAVSGSALAAPPTPPEGGGYGLGVRGAWGGPSNSLVAVAAPVLGMEPAELAAALAGGQTIAQVAEAQGVAIDEVVDAALAPRAGYIAQAVADGRLSQADADAMLASMRTQITAQLNAAHVPGGQGMGRAAGRGAGAGTGQAWVDADGDGVCDNLGTRTAPAGRGRWGR